MCLDFNFSLCPLVLRITYIQEKPASKQKAHLVKVASIPGGRFLPESIGFFQLLSSPYSLLVVLTTGARNRLLEGDRSC